MSAIEDGDGRNTRLVNLGRPGSTGVGGTQVNPTLDRASTILFPTMAALRQAEQGRATHGLGYGTWGTATHFQLEDAIAAVEGGTHCQVVGTGLAAITTPLLALLSTGDHLLVVDSIYGPTRRFCDTVLKRFGIETTTYDPRLSASEVGGLIRPNTRALLTESPGSNSFEMQDIAALAREAHARRVLLMLDNTWGFGNFAPFEHGVDISIQALTKYAGGHADLVLGAFIVADAALWRRLREASLTLGQYASPDDCWLALRGLRTLGVRLDRQAATALALARFLADRPEIGRVLHPALPGAPGHEIWRRDYTGSASLFGLEFSPRFDAADVDRFVDALRLFGKGWSWGGFESLANTVTGDIRRDHGVPGAGPIARLHVGLEDECDLRADLIQALDRLAGAGQAGRLRSATHDAGGAVDQ